MPRKEERRPAGHNQHTKASGHNQQIITHPPPRTLLSVRLPHPVSLPSLDPSGRAAHHPTCTSPSHTTPIPPYHTSRWMVSGAGRWVHASAALCSGLSLPSHPSSSRLPLIPFAVLRFPRRTWKVRTDIRKDFLRACNRKLTAPQFLRGTTSRPIKPLSIFGWNFQTNYFDHSCRNIRASPSFRKEHSKQN